jgi:hypothetical protein
MPIGNISSNLPLPNEEKSTTLSHKEDPDLIPVIIKPTSSGHVFKEVHSNMSAEKLQKAQKEGNFGILKISKSGEVLALKVDEKIKGKFENYNFQHCMFKKASGDKVKFALSSVKIQTLTGEESIYLNNALNEMFLAIAEARKKKEEENEKAEKEKEKIEKRKPHIINNNQNNTVSYTDTSPSTKPSDYLIPINPKSPHLETLAILQARNAFNVRRKRKEIKEHKEELKKNADIVEEEVKKWNEKQENIKKDTLDNLNKARDNIIRYTRLQNKKSKNK